MIKYVAAQIPKGGWHTVVLSCDLCEEEYRLDVQTLDFYSFRNGVSPYIVFPYLSESEKVLINGGMCGHCFDASNFELDIP